MKILVINTGSSTIKYRLFDMDGGKTLAAGLLENIGETGPGTEPVPDHRAGMDVILRALTDPRTGAVRATDEIAAVGHRVVHGGERFTAPAIIDERIIKAIRDHVPLAPLHNPANLDGIAAAQRLFPAIPHVAVFDTAFHQTMPPRAYRYALPAELYLQHGIRRYGFHGTSHQSAARQAALMLGRTPAELNLITIHLGNGSSMTAIAAGKSVDTSMGLTPLEGLVMGTRSGDLDPSIIFHLAATAGMALPAIAELLNKQSGMKGLTGENDMRVILKRIEAGDEAARLALDVYTYRIKKYLGAYFAVLGRVDAVVFTGGVAENAARVRADICEGLDGLGIILDPHDNQVPDTGSRTISASSSPVKVLVIPANEELEIARQVMIALSCS